MNKLEYWAFHYKEKIKRGVIGNQAKNCLGKMFASCETDSREKTDFINKSLIPDLASWYAENLEKNYVSMESVIKNTASALELTLRAAQIDEQNTSLDSYNKDRKKLDEYVKSKKLSSESRGAMSFFTGSDSFLSNLKLYGKFYFIPTISTLASVYNNPERFPQFHNKESLSCALLAYQNIPREEFWEAFLPTGFEKMTKSQGFKDTTEFIGTNAIKKFKERYQNQLEPKLISQATEIMKELFCSKENNINNLMNANYRWEIIDANRLGKDTNNIKVKNDRLVKHAHWNSNRDWYERAHYN